MTVSLLVLTALVGFPQADDGSANVVETGATLEKVWSEGSFTEGGHSTRTARFCFPTSATGS